MAADMDSPALCVISDDAGVMDDIMDRLELLGFMPMRGYLGLYPYEDFAEGYFQDNGTTPTHFLLTDERFDADADGPCCELLGEEGAREALSIGGSAAAQELGVEEVLDMIEAWEQQQ